MNSPIAPGQEHEAAGLRARVAELELRLQERGTRLEAAVNDLEAFAHSISHDLRAPLRGIAGFTRNLIEDHGASLDDEGRRTLHLIRDETRRMSELIDSLLVYSRIGRQQPDTAEIDMTELARSAFQNLGELMTARTPAFEVKPLPRARGDRGMVREILKNLLGNSIKFSGRQPAAAIEMTGWAGHDWSTYCVADNGVGFDQRYAHKLFIVFQRLHSQEEFEGSGVGLAVVQRIVQQHGGKTWAEGKASGGAKFFFHPAERQ